MKTPPAPTHIRFGGHPHPNINGNFPKPGRFSQTIHSVGGHHCSTREDKHRRYPPVPQKNSRSRLGLRFFSMTSPDFWPARERKTGITEVPFGRTELSLRLSWTEFGALASRGGPEGPWFQGMPEKLFFHDFPGGHFSKKKLEKLLRFLFCPDHRKIIFKWL